MSSLKVIHNRKNCIGCNSCVMIAPQNWVMDQQGGKSCLIGAREKKGLFMVDIHESDLEANKKAAEACPMNIIQIGGAKKG